MPYTVEDRRRFAEYQKTLTPEQEAKFAEYRVMMKSIAEVMKEYIGDQLKPILAQQQHLLEQVCRLQTQADKLTQQLSANQKHCQSLEKKLGTAR